MTPYEVLGVGPDASEAELKKAFTILAQIYHPDRYADLPEPVQREAARRMQELNEAYSLAKRGGGLAVKHMSRTSPTPPPPTRPAAWRSQSTFLGVPWQEAEKERRWQAEKAARERAARERAAPNGTAIARPKPARRREPVWAGLGEALVTNKLVCRRCDSIQHLPSGWKSQMEHMDFFCSICDRVILSKT